MFLSLGFGLGIYLPVITMEVWILLLSLLCQYHLKNSTSIKDGAITLVALENFFQIN